MNDHAGIAINEELDRFEEALALFNQGRLDEDRFLALRMSLGVYTQRQPGEYMVRLKLPGGCITTARLAALTEILDALPNAGSVHLTTRQDIQLKSIPGSALVALLRRIHQIGLITREAGGPTVRNIVACPLAGVCPREERDVLPVVHRLMARYLGNPLTRFLPRKFKIAVSGCAQECAQDPFNDLGITAERDAQGHLGYRVSMGGGLGHKPRKGKRLESWVNESELLPVVEAVLRLHHRHSDRERKSKARLKFLWERFADGQLRSLYREELKQTRQTMRSAARAIIPEREWVPVALADFPQRVTRAVVAQKQSGLFSVPVQVPLGDLTLEQLQGLSALAARLAIPEIRITTEMNLLLLHVTASALQQLPELLQALNLRLPRAGDDVSACVGSAVCNLGLTAAPLLARQLTGGPFDLKVRVSGCQNGCVQSDLCDIGLTGEIRRPHGIAMPFYRLLTGGRGIGDGVLGRCIGSFPAARAPRAVEIIQDAFARSGQSAQGFSAWVTGQSEQDLALLLKDLDQLSAEEAAELAQGQRDQAGFATQTGLNECAGSRKLNIEAVFARAAHERSCCQELWNLGQVTASLVRTREILQGLGATLLASSKLPVALSELDLEQVAFQACRRPYLGSPLGQRLLELSEQQGFLECHPDAHSGFGALLGDVDRWTLELAQLWMGEDVTLHLSPYLPAALPDDGSDEEALGEAVNNREVA
ncbi:MAG: nitrite/sulfite reductase [Magnetococcales bacterium]|nr:nitrite/sulfite reductase [Magnetococcales bacterium]